MDDLDLAGRAALVTGASSGIGAAVAARLVEAGARVVGASRRGAAEYTGATSLEVDLADEQALVEVVASTTALLGGLDIVVNAAGVADWRDSGAFTRDDFDATMHLNTWAPLRICQLARPHLAASGRGVVVNVGSVDATRPSPGGALYGASKAALAAMTVVLAKEWAADGIRAVQVDPGLVDTPLAADAVAAVERHPHPINLVRRVGRPEEVAAVVHLLVSDAGRFIDATSIRVDGGALALGPFDAVE